jgi:hypothetical protein
MELRRHLYACVSEIADIEVGSLEQLKVLAVLVTPAHGTSSACLSSTGPARFGGDPDFIVAAGSSAGGHLATLLGLTANDLPGRAI